MPIFGKSKSKDPADTAGEIRRAIEKGKDKVASGPAVLYLEATATCNLRCPMCPTTIGLPREPYRARLFDMDLLPAIEPVLPGVSRAFLSGGGEPLLHPRLFKIVEALKRHKIEVHFNSNATLMDEEKARAIIESGVDTISFSVDGATRATYEAVRVNASFGQVAENIRRLAELKNRLGSERPFMNMQFTLLDMNKGEAPAAVDLADSLGVNHLVVEPLTPVYCFDEEYREYYEAHRVEPSEVLADLGRAEARANELGLVFSSHYLWAERNPEPERRCRQPWLTFGVRVDGRVFTCCGMIEPMGDLAEDRFEQIWNGPKYRALRRVLSVGNFPPECSHCLAENRANHFNEDLIGP